MEKNNYHVEIETMMKEEMIELCMLCVWGRVVRLKQDTEGGCLFI